jgi:hypothetical protein
MAKILLIEPGYRNKYPPLGLMKISTYHRSLGDSITFTKGKHPALKDMMWDRIYISSLFTFNFNTTIDTIKYYSTSVEKLEDLYCGGVMATLLKDRILEKHKINIISGLLDKPGMLDDNDIIIDTLTPDYSIIDENKNEFLNYTYPLKDSYIAYSTRGCIRNCDFCAVSTIEPCFVGYVDIKNQINEIKRNYGEKKNLILLDNNVLASKNFDQIIDDIKEIGFAYNAKFTYKKNNRNISAQRYVDFNQGIDARLLTEEKCKKLSEIAIKPLRIAFDHADEESINLYKEKVRLSAKYGIKYLSNYILFNYDDSPEDLYKRLEINISLNEEFHNNDQSTRIFSFPMKYSPVSGDFCTNRNFIGKNWNRKYLRAIQCILNATHGVVGPKRPFFERAFGQNIEEFNKILSMPEKYILERKKYEKSGKTTSWYKDYQQFKNNQSLMSNIFNDDLKQLSKDTLAHPFLEYYIFN